MVWTGTDELGVNFQSVASRFSRLSSDELTNYTSTLKSTVAYNNLYDTASGKDPLAPSFAPTRLPSVSPSSSSTTTPTI